MAKVKFILQSKTNPVNIYLRLSIDKRTSFKRKTGYVINPNSWNHDSGYPKQNDADRKTLKTNLQEMANFIEKNLNKAVEQKNEITGSWLQEQIDSFQGTKKKTDPDRLSSYIQTYIDNLPYKEFPNNKRGVAKGTLQKYSTLKNKVVDFESYGKKQYYVKDVGLKFRDEFVKYLSEVDKLNANTTGRYIKFLKTVCLDAKGNGFPVHSQLDKIKGFTEKAPKIFLSFEELGKIENANFTRSALENAKDWLIIGCYIGQRVSDLLRLTSKNIHVRNGLELLELIQKKTGKRVSIPLHPKVREILDKRNGNFPEKISDPKFNLHIKDVCELAGINAMTAGSKLVNIGTETEPKWRKEHGIFPKHELITSHVCRRSFASNFYGEIPTALLISITAHSTEQQFLQYIGKTSNDYALQLAEYWNKEQLKANNITPMTVLKNAVSE